MTDKADVLRYIKDFHCGVNRAVSRDDLVSNFLEQDRVIRKLINELRNDGYPIVSNSKGSGYWYFNDTPTDREEAEIMIAEAKSRIREIRLSIVAVRKALSESQGQQVMFKEPVEQDSIFG